MAKHILVFLLSLTILPGLVYSQEWKLDKKSSYIRFHIDSMLNGVDGDFRSFSVEQVKIKGDESSGLIKIDTSSIYTANTKRDKHLRSEDFFYSKKYPFATVKVLNLKDDKATVEITIRGKTVKKEIPVQFKVSEGHVRASGHVILNRKKFDINYGVFYNPIKDNAVVRFRIHLVK